MVRKSTNKPAKSNLKLRKKPLRDLPPTKKKSDSLKGGTSPPYVPVGPVVIGDNIK